MNFDLTNPAFQSAEKAREYLESLHWPDGAVCPHCESMNVTKVGGKTARPGLYMCNGCRKQFTVTVGTIFEDSKIPLNKWLMAFALLNGSKKGISAHQLHRSLGITYKSAWFLAHRIREAMKDGGSPLGGKGKTVEADETYVGGKAHNHVWKAIPKKQIVVALVERDGKARSYHVANIHGNVLRPLLYTQVYRSSTLMTDQGAFYIGPGREFATHNTVNHKRQQYVSGEKHTNTVESFFSIFLRGVIGTYHHMSEAHLARYCAEFDFRYNTRKLSDTERTEEALKGARGKRLTYRQPSGIAA